MTDRLKAEQGFGLIELVMAMVLLQIALIALIGAFSAGSLGLARASRVNTGAVLADQQMELYRAMPYDAIGLDTAGAPTTGNYVADTSVCPSGQTPVCGNTAPRSNTASGTWSCTAATGTTSVSLYFSTNGVNPCIAERSVSSATSPDKHPYVVETYVKWGTLLTGQRSAKRVSVVVRDGRTGKRLAKEVTTFDCSTGAPTNTTC